MKQRVTIGSSWQSVLHWSLFGVPVRTVGKPATVLGFYATDNCYRYAAKLSSAATEELYVDSITFEPLKTRKSFAMDDVLWFPSGEVPIEVAEKITDF